MTNKIPFKTAHTGYPRVQFETVGPSLTHQSMAGETDINNIMRKFEKTGILEHRNTFEGKYGDFTDTPQDYHESMNAVLAANDMFETLPAKIRRRFGNDPGQFLDFVGDPNNSKEMIKMGLAKASKLQEKLVEDFNDPNATEQQKEAAQTSKSPSKDETSK